MTLFQMRKNGIQRDGEKIDAVKSASTWTRSNSSAVQVANECNKLQERWLMEKQGADSKEGQKIYGYLCLNSKVREFCSYG